MTRTTRGRRSVRLVAGDSTTDAVLRTRTRVGTGWQFMTAIS
ncbi:hypothetical protein ABZU25_23400 [Micromonospora sp. NPDC005215]